jgi:hypothetical protein
MGYGKRIVVAAISACLSAASAASQGVAPTVDELLAKYFAARGGLERLKSITTLRMTGRVEANGQTVEMSTVSKRPNLIRQEMTVQGQRIVSAFDGTRMWTINPMTGSKAPQVVPGPQAEMMKTQADFDGPLVDHRAKGHTIAYVGTETVEKRPTHRLKVRLKSGGEVLVDLDAETFLEVRLSREVDMAGAPATIETLMSDFRAVSGLMLPYAIRNVVNGQPQARIAVDRIDVDVPIDDGLFQMPRK